MTAPTPDLEGYKKAMLAKRTALGSSVVFRFPQSAEWPEGTVLNPNTGEPYDPLVEPVQESGRDPVEMSLSVAFRPNFQEDTDETEIGDIKMNVALTWVTLAEFEEAPNCIKLATSFDYMEDNYLIRKKTHEAIGGDAWRVLIWGERQGDAEELPAPPPEEEEE